MLALLLIYLYIFATSVFFGILTLELLIRFNFLEKLNNEYEIDIIFILGFIFLSVFLSFYSIFFKLGGFVPHFIIMFISSIVLFKIRNNIKWNFIVFFNKLKQHRWYLLIILPSLVQACNVAVQEPLHYDTGLYHAQNIQWMEKYPVVNGLGNMHDRLAFNSSFFIPSAFYGFSFVKEWTFFPINSMFFFLMIFRIGHEFRNSLCTRGIDRIVILILILCFMMGPLVINSPNTDSLSFFLMFYMFIIFFDLEFSNKTFPDYKLFSVVSIAAFIITVKLSMIPAIMILVFFFIRSIFLRNIKKMIFLVFLSMLIIMPWIIRNTILSGYLIYPFPEIDIFSFDWKIPYENVVKTRDMTKAWARMPGPQFMSVLDMPFGKWFPIWFSNNTILNQKIFILSLISPLVFLIIFLFDKRIKKYAFFWSVCFLGFLFWFFNAPDFRFGYNFIFFTITIPFGYSTKLFFEKTHVYDYMINKSKFFFANKKVILVIIKKHEALLLVLFIIHFSFIYFENIGKKWIYPIPLKSDIKVIEVKAKNFMVRLPTVDDRCFNVAIPCAPSYAFDPDLEMRGPDLRDGFRIANNHRNGL